MSRKQLCWSLLLIKLQAWRTPTQLFSCEYCEILWNSFLWNASRLWVQNWYFSYSLCHCFVFLHNSIRISLSWLFRTCFHTKIVTLVKCSFPTHYNVGSSSILIESVMFRNNSRITVTSPVIYCENYEFF